MVIVILLILVLAIVIPNIRIVPQATEFVIEFLGKYMHMSDPHNVEK